VNLNKFERDFSPSNRTDASCYCFESGVAVGN